MKWMDAFQKEWNASSIPEDLETIYIGGGTPTSLDADEMERLLSFISPYTKNVKEYTIEINPETLDEEKADLLRSFGISRVSIGLETSDAELLKLMGRHHTYADVQRCIRMLKERDITNISLDLMYSLPSQTFSSLKRSIQDALALSPTHLSLYSLTIEEHTAFASRGYQHLDDDTEADMYEYICETLQTYGFHQYEVSNFCLKGYESLHNTAYWNYDDFIGIGAGASGKEDHKRYDHTKSLKAYFEDPLKKEYIPLTKEDEMFEMIMMGVRLKRGMDIALFEERFHTDFFHQYEEKLVSLIDRGLVEIKDGYFRCTDAGFEIMNSVLVDLM